MEAALYFPKDERIYYVTDGCFYTWDDVAESAMRSLGVNAKTLVIPEALLRLAVNISDALAWFRSKPALIDRQRVIDISQISWTASSKVFFESHGFQPKYDLNKGLFETIEWCKKNSWL